MKQYRGNVQQVSNHLDRQWAVIWRVLRRYGIDPAEYRPAGADGGNGSPKRSGADQIVGGQISGGQTGDQKDNKDGDQVGDHVGDQDGDEDGDTLG